MTRFFNTTGPCEPRWHYMLAPEQRLPSLLNFVERNLYFVLHAARQTGKTTAMRAFAARLRDRGYVAVWATLETSQGSGAVEAAEPRWLSSIASSAEAVLPPALRPPAPAVVADRPPGERLRQWLSLWSQAVSPASVVLLLDEADVVTGPAMISMLRQLRAGFTDRPERFPSSVVLIGMRDLRDYLTQSKDGTPVNPGSPFNIKAGSLTLRGFTEAELGALYDQHTADTGQVFLPEAVARAFYWSQGQPFLVNALAGIAVDDLVPDRGQAVTAAHIDEARDRLIVSRTTHLDSLAQRLREARVARVLQSVLLSDVPQTVDYGHDDFQYVVDLGLIRRGPDGAEAANPLYREVLARRLSYNIQEGLPRPRWRWQTASGGLDMAALVAEFLKWWRTNAAIVEEHADRGYIEAVPHLAFMAFLQRVVNGSKGPVDPSTGGRGAGAPVPDGDAHPGGGFVHREFAAGRGAIDLLVEYAGFRHVIELKRVPPQHRSLETVREEGVEQLTGYLGAVGVAEGWLLIFDQRVGKTWEDRLWTEEVEVRGCRIHLRGA